MPPKMESNGKERLHKVLASGGFGSRRACEQMIQLGEVEVDGEVVTDVGVRVDPGTQKIKCSGRYFRPARPVTLVMNKPRGYLCTSKDEHGRKTVFQLINKSPERLFTVGRLDAESQGLLLITNDGELCQMLTHPRYEVPRVYHVRGVGKVTPEALRKLQRGVWLAEGKSGSVEARLKSRERGQKGEERFVLEVTVREGINREVRRVLSRVGLRVKRLKRVRFGPLSLGRLPEGAFRLLGREEVSQLKEKLRKAPKAKKGKTRERRTSRK